MLRSNPAKESYPTRLGRREAEEAAIKHASQLAKFQVRPAASSNFMEPAFANQQIESLFLQSFPYEVRSMIYNYVLSEIKDNIHIENWGQSQSSQPCLVVEPYQPPERSARLALFDYDSWGIRHRTCRLASRKGGIPTTEPQAYFSLIISCRRIYIKTIGHVYAKVAFHLMHLFSAERFFVATPRHQLDLIRTVRVSWMLNNKDLYERTGEFNFILGEGTREKQVSKFRASRVLEESWAQTCDALSHMPLLSTVRIIILSLGIRIPEDALLKPLLSITQVKDFEVQLPWTEANPAWNSLPRELPFKIRLVERFDEGEFVSLGTRCHGGSRGRYRRPSLVSWFYPPFYVQKVRRRLEYNGYL